MKSAWAEPWAQLGASLLRCRGRQLGTGAAQGWQANGADPLRSPRADARVAAHHTARGWTANPKGMHRLKRSGGLNRWFADNQKRAGPGESSLEGSRENRHQRGAMGCQGDASADGRPVPGT